MTRPIFESPEDRHRQFVAGQKFAAFMGFTLADNPYSYGADWCTIVGPGRLITGWAEIKCRPNDSFKKFDDWFISGQKFLRCIEFSKLSKTPFYILFQWNDGLFYCKHEEGRVYQWRHTGRTVQTRDAGDLEPMVYIPAFLFLKIA